MLPPFYRDSNLWEAPGQGTNSHFQGMEMIFGNREPGLAVGASQPIACSLNTEGDRGAGHLMEPRTLLPTTGKSNGLWNFWLPLIPRIRFLSLGERKGPSRNR